MKIRVISDVHGKIDRYLKIASQVEYSIQLGDMGFDYSQINLDPKRHIFFGGNHDNYDIINDSPNCVGDVGILSDTHIDNNIKLFFVRGADSIDKDWRTPGLSWWPNEQLSNEDLYGATDWYQEVCPDIMFSHTGPMTNGLGVEMCNPAFGGYNPTRTEFWLNAMWKEHKPKIWFFGHWHKRLDKVIDGTRFICGEELDYFDLDMDTLEITKGFE